MKKRNLYSMVLTLLMPMFIYGQSVSGTVTSESGEPLVGANVVVNGTDLGAAVDAVSQTIELKAQFNKKYESLIPGMSGIVKFWAKIKT